MRSRDLRPRKPDSTHTMGSVDSSQIAQRIDDNGSLRICHIKYPGVGFASLWKFNIVIEM